MRGFLLKSFFSVPPTVTPKYLKEVPASKVYRLFILEALESILRLLSLLSYQIFVLLHPNIL